ncbi:UDP-glucuronosyltransferase 1A6-like isoform 6-T6 [Theristicus caerulescens]
MTLWLCCAWIFILLLPGLSDGGKLLVVPMDGSHWLSMRQVVEKLTERGHEVVVVIPEVSWQMKTTQAYTVKTYPVSYTLEELNNAFREYVATHLKDLPFPLNTLALYNTSVHVFRTFFVQCKDLFSSKETLQYLNQSSFDAVLTDPIFMCGATVAHYLSLPFVFFMRGFPCNLHYEAPQCPSPLSYTPRLFTFNSDHMTFFQRVENALVALLERGYCNGFYEDVIKFSSEVLQRDVSLLDLLNSASIWLLRFDFVFEYVRPVMPNMVFIGGINCAQRKPLSKHLLYDDELMKYLHDSKLHAIMMDPVLPCGPIVAESLSPFSVLHAWSSMYLRLQSHPVSQSFFLHAKDFHVQFRSHDIYGACEETPGWVFKAFVLLSVLCKI